MARSVRSTVHCRVPRQWREANAGAPLQSSRRGRAEDARRLINRQGPRSRDAQSIDPQRREYETAADEEDQRFADKFELLAESHVGEALLDLVARLSAV